MSGRSRPLFDWRDRRIRVGAIATALLAAGLLLSHCDGFLSGGRGGARAVGGPLPATSGSPWFALLSEMYGDAVPLAQQRLAAGLLTGATFHATLTPSQRQFVVSGGSPFAYFAIPAEAGVQACYPGSDDPGAASVLASLTEALGPKVWRLGMPEFDQGGGCWAAGRPAFGGMSDAAAYGAWTQFYLDGKRLRPYLAPGPDGRGYAWMSACVFAFCPQYAFDLGSDAVLLERNTDETSGITPGLAMLRGAATQAGEKVWGIDFSTWRYWTNGATVYRSGQLASGWSTSTFKRNLYIAYMGGANLVHGEAADYTAGAAAGATLNPLGQVVQEFHDFAVQRHPDRGTPFVPMAILQQHESGFEPRFGEWMQGSSKWYWANAWSDGDRLFANLLAAIYPGYDRWGTLPDASPKVVAPDGAVDVARTVAAYQAALAAGADPRGWEPMASARWGETFDVITDRAPADVLRRYRAIVIATGTPLDGGLVAKLQEYAQGGGVVVLNARQLSDSAAALAGVDVTRRRGTGSDTTWVSDGTVLHDPPYDYAVVAPTTAAVVARAGEDAIVTRNAVGGGAVYLTTPDLLSDRSRGQLLRVGEKLIDVLQAAVAVVGVSGPAIEYLVSTDGGRVIVTLVNVDLGGATWNGRLSFAQPRSTYVVREWTGDTPVASSVQGGQVVVDASVPPFDVRVFVLDPG